MKGPEHSIETILWNKRMRDRLYWFGRVIPKDAAQLPSTSWSNRIWFFKKERATQTHQCYAWFPAVLIAEAFLPKYNISNNKRINEDDNLCGSSKDNLLALGFVDGSWKIPIGMLIKHRMECLLILTFILTGLVVFFVGGTNITIGELF